MMDTEQCLLKLGRILPFPSYILNITAFSMERILKWYIDEVRWMFGIGNI
jgi:hypothetical protein